MRKTIALACALSVLAAGVASAAPISIGGATFNGGLDDFPTTATLISGSVSQFGTVTCPTQTLVGADIDTGCFNLDSNDVIRLDYGRTFGNQAGADIYFTDARFSNDALDFSLDGTSFFTIAAGNFFDTGVDSSIRGSGFPFNLFAALVDLSDYGFAAGGSFSSIWLRGNGESDPIVVGLLGGEAPVIPLPATLPLLAIGLGALGLARRRA